MAGHLQSTGRSYWIGHMNLPRPCYNLELSNNQMLLSWPRTKNIAINFEAWVHLYFVFFDRLHVLTIKHISTDYSFEMKTFWSFIEMKFSIILMFLRDIRPFIAHRVTESESHRVTPFPHPIPVGEILLCPFLINSPTRFALWGIIVLLLCNNWSQTAKEWYFFAFLCIVFWFDFIDFHDKTN